MKNPDLIKKRKAQIAFNAISIEGGLLPPEWLAKVAHLQAESQAEADYKIPKGLNLRDEIGRSYRIAQGLWEDYKNNEDTSEFILQLLKTCLGFDDILEMKPIILKERVYPFVRCASNGKVPIVIALKDEGLDNLSSRYSDGTRRRSAFGLCQEYLNISDDVLWGIVSCGNIIRVLRDNSSLTKPAWIEIDLKRIFDEELFSDFVAFWLICHRSRFGLPNHRAQECIFEKWRETSRIEGVRATDQLRIGVEAAIETLGQGFLSSYKNNYLRQSLRNGTLTVQDFYQELLRLVYRIIFLLTVEERNLLHPKETADDIKSIYKKGYGISKLRDRSIKRNAHDRFEDQWQVLKIVFNGMYKGEPHLGIPALGGLFGKAQTPYLDQGTLENRFLLSAIYKLSWLKDNGCIARINWRDMGSEELGSIYESLLELVPQIREEGRTFSFANGTETQGNTRKLTGSYYTPDCLVQSLLDTALEPVLATTIRLNKDRPVDALLKLSIVDPACGSGHFLLGAARRLALHIARLEVDGAPTADDYRKALRLVIGHCIYGVDLNPMAVELCKVSLWLEAIDPSKPLSFLDHHIRVGNSLIGATPELIVAGLPDDAFNAIEGDDKKVCASLKKINKAERSNRGPLFVELDSQRQAQLQRSASALAEISDDHLEKIQLKEQHFKAQEKTEAFLLQKKLADAWCSAFVIRKQVAGNGWERKESGITQGYLNVLANGQSSSTEFDQEIENLAEQYQFFHWHLAFPEVFAKEGFDCVLGNPPWERVKLQEKEWFAEKNPKIASAPNASVRKKLIEELKMDMPGVYQKFLEDSRKAEGESHFLRNSGLYPLCGRGDINLYTVFAEGMRGLLKNNGRAGCVLPSGIATADTTKIFFQDIIEGQSLISLFDFENKGLFPAVHNSMKFCLFTCSNGKEPLAKQAEFVFFAHSVDDLKDPDRRFTLSADDIALLNPNTKTCPVFRSKRDAELTKAIYRRVPVLIREAQNDLPGENPWGIKFSTMFHMSNDSYLFRTKQELEMDGYQLEGNVFHKANKKYLPLYEAKMIHHFDHRWATYDQDGDIREATAVEKQNPSYSIMPRYWIEMKEVETKLDGKLDRKWLFGFRDITNTTNERTVLAAIFNQAAVANNLPVCYLNHDIPHSIASIFTASISSFACDFPSRFKVGGTHLNLFIAAQLPILPPTTYSQLCTWSENQITFKDWLFPRILELTYSSWDLKQFAQDLGYNDPPFFWSEERRFLLRCELDAAFFHLYLGPPNEWLQKPASLVESFPTSRHAVDYIMETFPIVKRRDETKFNGDYRTKKVILEIYDAITDSIRTGKPYQTRLDPPPADKGIAHENKPNLYGRALLKEIVAAPIDDQFL